MFTAEDEFHAKLPERSKAIKYFIDWYVANVDKFNLYDFDLDDKLYAGYVAYWKTLG